MLTYTIIPTPALSAVQLNSLMSAFVSSTFPIPRRRRQPLRCSTRAAAAPPSQHEPPPRVQAVADRLREELPTLFDKQSNPDYSLYSDSVTFEDPLNKFRGVSRYAANIKFLNSSPVFSSAKLFLYDVRVIGPQQSTVRTRWALQMVANLPWRPCVAFTGQSDYVVDKRGKVYKHIDYWDSLSDSAFFSLPAVFDLLGQCKPGRISPLELGGFQLLRRTPLLQVRKFENKGREGILLKQTSKQSGLQEWTVDTTVAFEEMDASSSSVVNLAAVKTLDDEPSAQSLDHAERELRKFLETSDYATAGKNSFYVKSSLQGRPVFEVWVELVSASANVDD